MELNQIDDRVILKVVDNSRSGTTKGGVILPDLGAETTVEGEVLAVGPGASSLVAERIRSAMQCKVGDIVIFPKNLAKRIDVDDEELFVIKEHEILTILKENK